MSSYCDIAPGHPFHGPYHGGEYGFPSRDDKVLFERLILEINQAGLSWLTILKKREAFQAAFDGFDIDKVAAYGEREKRRLLADAGIIRNRLKVDAAIENARRLQAIRAEPWLLRRLARSPSSARQGRLGQAVQEDLPFHRRGDRRRVPDEPGISARGPCARLSGRQEDRPAGAALGQGKEAHPAPGRLGAAIIPHRTSALELHGQGPDPRLKSRSLDPKEMNDLCASPPISFQR